jgi:hypothetical protein
MKNFLISTAFYFLCITLCVTIVSILTGVEGSIPVRVVIAMALALYKPLDKK